MSVMAEGPLRVLVTGSSGFVGAHLVTLLLAEGAEVTGVDRVRPSGALKPDHPRFHVVHADLETPGLLDQLMAQVRPTHICHLAGVLGGVPGGYAVQHEANVLLTIRLLEAVRASHLNPWILVASSSAVYGATSPEENPLGEDRPLRPITHYGVSKVAQEMAALQCHLAYGLKTVRVRTFNLVGPGQSHTLLASDVVSQVARAEQRGADLLVRVGDRFPRRDYTDVRDAVRAYRLLMSQAQPGGVYNVCSGRSYAVQACLDILAGLVSAPLKVEVDERRIRAVDVADQVGDPRRLRAATGWEAQLPLEVSLRDLLVEWRGKVREAIAVGADVH